MTYISNLNKIIICMDNDKYTVWVGGVEVNDCLLPKEKAVEVANSYRKQGYKDVHIEKIFNKIFNITENEESN